MENDNSLANTKWVARFMPLSNTPKHEMLSIHAGLNAAFENGTLRPIINKELPLTEAPRAHQLVMMPGAYGKICSRSVDYGTQGTGYSWH